jgi:hypothetical protein
MQNNEEELSPEEIRNTYLDQLDELSSILSMKTFSREKVHEMVSIFKMIIRHLAMITEGSEPTKKDKEIMQRMVDILVHVSIQHRHHLN